CHPGCRQAGARTLRSHAARAWNARGSACGFRSHPEEGAESSGRLCWRGKSGRKGRRFSQGPGVLWQSGRDRQQCRLDPRRGRRGARAVEIERRDRAEKVVRALFKLILLGAFATPAAAEPLELFGYAGVLGEWELTASVAANDRTKDFVGPLTMT